MKNKQRDCRNTKDTLAWGLLIGFFGGVVFDNIALGLIAGVVIGSLPKVMNYRKK